MLKEINFETVIEQDLMIKNRGYVKGDILRSNHSHHQRRHRKN